MTVTSELLNLIAWEQKSRRVKPEEIRITKSSFDKLKAEVESGCLVLEPSDGPPKFNGVMLQVID
ncbi:hypothetical protein [Zoogloea sp.]|uniref:hypothetical protein n=1 Tax=Zoogloea sp. TaxID=49181 RepID=UPI002636DADC|nr:hypothetical protein [Zoogloea sp.]MDD3353874.1 hypothetical protein [Zoogloea sp.]